MFQAERQKDITKLIVAFRYFANMPKDRTWYFDQSVASEWPADKKVNTPLIYRIPANYKDNDQT